MLAVRAPEIEFDARRQATAENPSQREERMIAGSRHSVHGSSLRLVTNTFRSNFGSTPSGVSRAPGGVSWIGEATDYNRGKEQGCLAS